MRKSWVFFGAAILVAVLLPAAVLALEAELSDNLYDFQRFYEPSASQ